MFKLEGSVFNGREPNEERWSIQMAALDSWSARVSAAPAQLDGAIQLWALMHPEALEPGNERRRGGISPDSRPFADGGDVRGMGTQLQGSNTTNLNNYCAIDYKGRQRNYYTD
jgi:hypothetical protein